MANWFRCESNVSCLVISSAFGGFVTLVLVLKTYTIYLMANAFATTPGFMKVLEKIF